MKNVTETNAVCGYWLFDAVDFAARVRLLKSHTVRFVGLREATSDGQSNGQDKKERNGQDKKQTNELAKGQGDQRDKEQANAKIKSAVKRLKGKLTSIIVPDTVLLSGMRKRGMITRCEMEEIGSETVKDKAVEKLLNIMLKNPKCDFSEFTKVLEEAAQEHVMNFIKSQGGTYITGYFSSLQQLL